MVLKVSSFADLLIVAAILRGSLCLDVISEDPSQRLGTGRAASLRPGKATETHSCDHIRGVPDELRDKANMKPDGLGNFYQKYTEAYGIPVLGSKNVPDEALKRACYTTRVLFADNPLVRQSYYERSGRVAVIGVNENTNDIPEHSDLPNWWNMRARGLGATDDAPVCTDGEENVMCMSSSVDRWADEDNMVHYLAHGLHMLAAKYAIPGFEARLGNAYRSAKASGKWASTSAISNAYMYFIEGAQSFFNCNPNYTEHHMFHNTINTRSELKDYDPLLYDVLLEVFPCQNDYLLRCSSTWVQESNQILKMNCPTKLPQKVPYCQDENKACSAWALIGECDINSNYKYNTCKFSCGTC